MLYSKYQNLNNVELCIVKLWALLVCLHAAGYVLSCGIHLIVLIIIIINNNNSFIALAFTLYTSRIYMYCRLVENSLK